MAWVHQKVSIARHVPSTRASEPAIGVGDRQADDNSLEANGAAASIQVMRPRGRGGAVARNSQPSNAGGRWGS